MIMRERIEDVVRYYERKKEYFTKKVEEKREILAGVLNRYDKGEVKYELVEKCSKDLAIKEDTLILINQFLRDLSCIKGDE